jgi:hypothetical protein
MSEKNVLSELESLGFSITLEEKLLVKPSAKITDEIRDLVRSKKSELIALFKQRTSAPAQERVKVEQTVDEFKSESTDAGRIPELLQIALDRASKEVIQELLTELDYDFGERAAIIGESVNAPKQMAELFAALDCVKRWLGIPVIKDTCGGAASS